MCRTFVPCSWTKNPTPVSSLPFLIMLLAAPERIYFQNPHHIILILSADVIQWSIDCYLPAWSLSTFSPTLHCWRRSRQSYDAEGVGHSSEYVDYIGG